MGEYNDELKQIRTMLKKEMLKSGIKNVSIKGQRGTGWGWTDIFPAKKNKQGYYNWEEPELKKLSEFGIRNPSGDIMRVHELKTMLYGHQAKQFKEKEEYQKFKADFINEALKHEDSGTCVGGCSTIIKRAGKPIDLIRQQGMSEHRNWVASQIMKNRAEALGLELEHEGGWMD